MADIMMVDAGIGLTHSDRMLGDIALGGGICILRAPAFSFSFYMTYAVKSNVRDGNKGDLWDHPV
jgi:hypothetical protein